MTSALAAILDYLYNAPFPPRTRPTQHVKDYVLTLMFLTTEDMDPNYMAAKSSVIPEERK